jgi:hypothetical protein
VIKVGTQNIDSRNKENRQQRFHEVSDGNKDSIGNRTTAIMLHSGKEFVCILSMWEAEFKGDGLINLAEEISRQQSIQVVA